MKIKSASDAYVEAASKLSEEEAERLQSRMRGKLARRLSDEKLNTLEALAIQLELDDEQLQEWRERMHEIKAKIAKQVAKSSKK
jgi:hypothetical protein